MKPLLTIIAFLLLNLVYAAPSDTSYVFEKKGLFGAKDFQGQEIVPTKFTELYKVISTENIYFPVDKGFLGRKGASKWSFYDTKGELKVDTLVFDEWIGNSEFDASFVMHEGKVKVFHHQTSSIKTIWDNNMYDDEIDYTEEVKVPFEVVIRSEISGKMGVFDDYGRVKLPFEYTDVHRITDKFYAAGYVARKYDDWTYMNRFFEVQKEGIQFDEWIANSQFDHSYVLIDGMVKMFHLEKQEVLELVSDEEHYNEKSTLFIVKNANSGNQGAFNWKGEVKIPFKYYEIFKPSWRSEKKPFLARYADKTGDFYTNDGEFILYCKEYPTTLGVGEYVRLSNGTDRNTKRAALGLLDIDAKEIIRITEFDFWFMNAAPQKEGSTRIAIADYRDGKQAYIHSDGRIEPIKEED